MSDSGSGYSSFRPTTSANSQAPAHQGTAACSGAGKNASSRGLLQQAAETTASENASLDQLPRYHATGNIGKTVSSFLTESHQHFPGNPSNERMG